MAAAVLSSAEDDRQQGENGGCRKQALSLCSRRKKPSESEKNHIHPLQNYTPSGMGLQGRGKALPGGEGFPKLLRYALDTPADGTELFFDAAVAAVDMSACVVHERFAFGAESCEDERRARAQVGRAYSCAVRYGVPSTTATRFSTRICAPSRASSAACIKRFSKIVSRNTLVPGVLQATAIIGA